MAIVNVVSGDSTATIQSKMNSLGSGDTLQFPAGSSFNFTSSIVGKSNITVLANGIVTITGPAMSSGGAFNFNSLSGWTVRGLTAGTGFVFNGCGVSADNALGGWTVGNCKFQSIASNGFDGSAIAMNGASFGTVINNDFTDVSGSTLGSFSWDNITIDGNHFLRCAQGVSLDQPTTPNTSIGRNLLFIRNTFKKIKRAALEMGPGGNQYFNNLQVINNWFDDFENDTATYGTGTLLPISLVGQAAVNTTVQGNYMRQGTFNPGYISVGIEFAGSGDCSGNTIINFAYAVLTYVSGWNIHGNTYYTDTTSAHFGFVNNGSGSGTFGSETVLTNPPTAQPAVPAEPTRIAYPAGSNPSQGTGASSSTSTATAHPVGGIIDVLTTDATAAIQAKMNSLNFGDTLRFPGGNSWALTAPIVGKNGVTVLANGACTITGPNAGTSGAFDFSNKSSWTIRGNSPGAGFVFSTTHVNANGATGWTIGNCVFSSCPDQYPQGSAIQMEGAYSALVINNDFTSCGGVTLGCFEWDNVTIDGCHFSSCTQPFSISNSNSLTVGRNLTWRRCSFTGITRVGAETGSSNAPTLDGNFFNCLVENCYANNESFNANDIQGIISIVGGNATGSIVRNNWFRRGAVESGTALPTAIELLGPCQVYGNTIINFSYWLMLWSSTGSSVHDNLIWHDGTVTNYQGNIDEGGVTYANNTVATSGEPADPGTPARVTWPFVTTYNAVATGTSSVSANGITLKRGAAASTGQSAVLGRSPTNVAQAAGVGTASGISGVRSIATSAGAGAAAGIGRKIAATAGHALGAGTAAGFRATVTFSLGQSVAFSTVLGRSPTGSLGSFIQLIVDSATVYSTAIASYAGFANGMSIINGAGTKRATATGSAVASASVLGRPFQGNVASANGASITLGQGTSFGGGGAIQHVVLNVDSVTVYDNGGGGSFFYAGTGAGSSSVAAVGRSSRRGVAASASISVAHAQGLAPNQGVGVCSAFSTVNGRVFVSGVAFAAGIGQAGSSLIVTVPPPLTGRSFTDTMATAIVQPVVRPIIMYQGSFKGGILNLWSGLGDITYNGIVWTGAGGLLTISPVEETDQQQASGIIVSMSAIPSSKIALALAEVQRNQPGQVWLGLLDANEQIIDKPQTIFRGRMDTVSIEDGQDTAIIKLSYENEMITLEHPRELRYTDQTQKQLYPGDRGCEFVAGLQDQTLRWGSRA